MRGRFPRFISPAPAPPSSRVPSASAHRLRHVALTRVAPHQLRRTLPQVNLHGEANESRGHPAAEEPRAMQSPPDWPPVPGPLRPSPFPNPVLHALHSLARALLFPAYWALDQLLGCWAPIARPSCLKWLRAAAGAGAALLLIVVIGLPLTLPGLLLWLPLQAWRRPFCYQPPPQSWAPPAPWRPPAEPPRCFSFLSANVCLLPDGLARFSNLRHTQRRAEAVGAVLLAGLRPLRYGTMGCSPPATGAPGGVLIATVPVGLDFVCLQEVFDLRAARRLVSRLAPNLGPVLYDVGTFGLQPGPHLKLLGSGLLLASRYPLLRAAFRSFPDARREDALASKGLLSAQVTACREQSSPAGEEVGCGVERRGLLGLSMVLQAQVGLLDGRRIVGFLHCTHLHAPIGEPYLRGHACRPIRLSAWGRIPLPTIFSLPPTPRVPECRVGSQMAGNGGGGGGGVLPCSGLQTAPWAEPSSTTTPTPSEDGPLRCKQLTLLLDWAEQFEAESRHTDEVVAFSVLLGDLNFDNCSLSEGRLQRGDWAGGGGGLAPPT